MLLPDRSIFTMSEGRLDGTLLKPARKKRRHHSTCRRSLDVRRPKNRRHRIPPTGGKLCGKDTLRIKETQMEEMETEIEKEKDAPLVAIRPDASFSEMLSLGKISKTKVDKLKAIYIQLSDEVKSAQDSEDQLLEEAKRLRAELRRLQADLEKSGELSFSEEPTSEAGKLRQQLLRAFNELRAAEDRDYMTQHQLKWLQEEKRCLLKENNMPPKLDIPQELESTTVTLQDKCEKLKKEVGQRQMEVRGLKEDMETYQMQTLKGEKELEDAEKILQLKEAEKAQLLAAPEQILKEIGEKRSKREAAVKTLGAMDAQFSEMTQKAKEVDEHNDLLRAQKEELAKELEGLQAQVEASQRRCSQLQKEHEVLREEEAELMGHRGILEMKLQNIMCERKLLCESRSVQLKEKKRQMQVFKRMERALTIATEQLKHTQSTCTDLQAQLDALPKRGAGIAQRMALQKEVDALKVSIEKQLSRAEKASQKQQQSGIIQELLRESDGLREELHHLRCLTYIKAEERGQKHREMLRAEQMNQHIQQELREKELIKMHHSKLSAMLQRRVLQYGELCNVITEEKNKYVKLKQIASQTITELMEQAKVLENELEIQKSIVTKKDRLLAKVHKKLSNSCKIRDKLRNNINKVAWQSRLVRQEREDNEVELQTLRQMISLQEQALSDMIKNQEGAVQRRNFLGIQLLEHEEVLFDYQEKVNTQEAAIAEGNVALENLEKEMRDLKVAISEEKRQIGFKKKEVLVQKKMEEELIMLQLEMLEVRDQTLDNLTKTADYKELKGSDPSSSELFKKIEKLEASLAERERQLLERGLLVDQVTRLSKDLQEQKDNCQQDKLSLAKKLNELRTHIIDISRRLMATSAELSMKQAAVLCLQQEVKEKELQMERCQRRLEQGLPPCPEMEEEWRRMLRDKKRRQRDKDERERLADEDEWKQLANGQYTTAESRPDAYIPHTDALPLPKPYGAQAPFKPSQPGVMVCVIIHCWQLLRAVGSI
ncbi:coiled-coil domain-containing protein 146 isoform X5 [Phyllopteryx taeniolatus]|uniref:coiled-coil domain-containing protein 146 isoform X5 n=2 Tax=Phyllopteryx taeniolatus TaxID=161469 RepID=UPI002AD5A8F9|nr:coiled-coil domain-containing protein 146 isoform X5 [Phyllopteryx taeniolatus]